MSLKPWSTPITQESKMAIPCVLCGASSFKSSINCGDFSYVRCTRCSLVQINPQPMEDEVKKRYGELWGEDYLLYELGNEKNFLNLALLALKDAGFDHIEEKLMKVGKARVLDIGCATGALLAELRERGWECTGVEISGPQAEYARLNKNLDIKNKALEENHFSDCSFEIVIASHLIEHLNDPAAFVNEVKRIIIPGGWFILTTPNLAGFQARFFGSKWRSAINDHLYLFSVNTLSALLKKGGFIIEKTVTWGGLAAGIVPPIIKRFFDKAAKRFGFGDVMVIRVKKPL